MIVGIILAAGKGTRMKSKDKNKVTLTFLNKPLIVYSVELMEKIVDKTIVVIGAYHESVKEVLKDFNVFYAYQKKRLGTAHAVKVAVDEIIKKKLNPEIILVGYGDHTMFYRNKDIENLIKIHRQEKAVMTIITVKHNNDFLHWGFVIRNKKNEIIDSVEYKDASLEIKKKVKELNAGFYCFDFNFLKQYINQVSKSLITGEYYLNSLIKIAVDNGLKVSALKVPFSSVGIGINRFDELEESQRLYLKVRK